MTIVRLLHYVIVREYLSVSLQLRGLRVQAQRGHLFIVYDFIKKDIFINRVYISHHLKQLHIRLK